MQISHKIYSIYESVLYLNGFYRRNAKVTNKDPFLIK